LTSIEYNNDNIIDFILDHSLIDTSIVKRIGIEKSTNSIIVQVYDQLLLQDISMVSFSKDTIKPLRNQLDQTFTEFQDKDKKTNLISSIITCINYNVNEISKHFEQTDPSSNPEEISTRNESGKIDNLIHLALDPESLEKLFKDQYGKPFAAIRLGSDRHLEAIPINSTKYKRYLSKLNRDNTGSSISDSSLSTVITNLAAEAEFQDEIIPLHLRVAWGSKANRTREDCIYYDMCDSQGRVIEISKDGWKIINGNCDNAPILFKRFSQQPLVEPVKNYPADIFDKFLNITNIKNPKHRHLIKVYIISTLIPEIDHFILTTYGPKGAAKSFLLELIKKLIDPSKPTLLTLQRNVDQFIQQVNHYYINYYDNIKYIPSWLSDEICKAVSGIGHTKRAHYTDDDDFVYEHKRCLGLNGINVALTESDALDRSIFIELEEIDDENRRKEEDLWKEFEAIKPQVLGYILDVLSKAMQIKPTLRLHRLPRMADATEWSEAISQAMGYPPLSFLEAYTENRNELNIIAVNENPVGSLVVKYIQNIERQMEPITKTEFELQELYKILVDFAASNDISITDRYFPKNAASFVKKLKIVIPNIKAAYGIIIEIGRNTTTNTSIISFSRKKTIIVYKDKPASGGTEAPDPNSTTLYKEDIEKFGSITNDDNTNAVDSNKHLNQDKGAANDT
jgi:hypothetical protein